MIKSRLFSALVALFFVFAPAAFAADSATPDDNARILAGLPVAEASPLYSVQRDPSWQQHSRRFNSSWTQLEQRQLSRIAAWSGKNLTKRQPVLYYMFSGPDFLYANAFYPGAPVTIMSGLEPVGDIPDLVRTRGSLAHDLRGLEQSLNSVLSFGFFITKKMRHELVESRLTGTLPVLYVFLARSGKIVKDVSLIGLDTDGVVVPRGTGAASAKVGPAKGAKIVFASEGGPDQTLYYFSTDVSDGGVKSSGFLKFCDTFGPGEALLKSASYLMHSGSISKVREFVLSHSATLVQDDSGIPVDYLKRAGWTLQPFGRYLGPIDTFPGRFQASLSEVFRKGNTKPIDFSIGYRWHSNESNLLLATNPQVVQAVAAPAATPVTPKPAAPPVAATTPELAPLPAPPPAAVVAQPAAPTPDAAAAAPVVAPLPAPAPAAPVVATPAPVAAPTPAPVVEAPKPAAIVAPPAPAPVVVPPPPASTAGMSPTDRAAAAAAAAEAAGSAAPQAR